MIRNERLTVLFMAKDNQNPYVEILKNSLESIDIDVQDVDWPVLFPLTRTAIASSDRSVMQLDWLYRFYISDGYTGSKFVDDVITIYRATLLLLDLIIVKFLPITIVWTIHNKYHHEQKYQRTERIINETLLWVADSTTVKCEEARDIILNTYRNAQYQDPEIISDGSYINTYTNTVSKREARKDIDVLEDEFIYLFFGMVREYKGIPELIDAFDELSIKDAQLWIVGKPRPEEFGQYLQELVKGVDGVHLVFNYVPDDRIQYYLNMADVLVLPYRDILNSGSTHLGMSFGLPIIAPQIGCIPATVSDDNRKFLYGDGEKALKRKMEIAYSTGTIELTGRSNFEKASRQEWVETAKNLVEVYESVL